MRLNDFSDFSLLFRHMEKLDLQNLDAQQEELVRRVREMREGDVYV
jgi:hypothetical protein